MQRGQEGDAWSQQLPGICVSCIQENSETNPEAPAGVRGQKARQELVGSF